LRIFLLQFCEFSVILWFNLYKILDFDRNNLYTHFCYSELLILREKRFADFLFGQKKFTNFQKILKIHPVYIALVGQTAGPNLLIFLRKPIRITLAQIILKFLNFHGQHRAFQLKSLKKTMRGWTAGVAKSNIINLGNIRFSG